MKAKDRCKANWQGDKCRLSLQHAPKIHKGQFTEWMDLLGKVNVLQDSILVENPEANLDDLAEALGS